MAERTVIITGLTRTITSPHLSEILGTFGTVESANISYDNVTKLSLGRASIIMSDEATAKRVVAVMQNGQIDGKFITGLWQVNINPQLIIPAAIQADIKPRKRDEGRRARSRSRSTRRRKSVSRSRSRSRSHDRRRR